MNQYYEERNEVMGYNYDVIIIGSGIGGISCGALLSHAGLKTLVLERNSVLGGRCCSYEKNGSIIDTFVHVVPLCEKGPFGEILQITEMPDAIKFWHPDAMNKPALFLGGHPYVYPDPSYATLEDIENTIKGLRLPDNEYQVMLRLNEIIYTMPKEETHQLDAVTYGDWIKKYSSHEMALAFHNDRSMLMCAVGLFEASAGEVIRAAQSWHLSRNLGYPMGGCRAISDGLADIIRNYGGEVRPRAAVKEVMVDCGAAVGVRLNNGEEVTARAIVSNVGLKGTVKNLVPEGALTKDYCHYIEGLSYGIFNADKFVTAMLSVHVLLEERVIDAPLVWGIPLAAAGSLIQPISDLGERGQVNRKILDQLSLYMTVPTNMDPSLSPEGRQLINFHAILLPGATTKSCVESYLNILDLLYPGVKRHVCWWEAIKGSAIKEHSGHAQSDIIGLSPLVGQVGNDRPPIESPLPGLFYVGADVGQDNIGTVLAAESALRAADIVKDYLGK